MESAQYALGLRKPANSSLVRSLHSHKKSPRFTTEPRACEEPGLLKQHHIFRVYRVEAVHRLIPRIAILHFGRMEARSLKIRHQRLDLGFGLRLYRSFVESLSIFALHRGSRHHRRWRIALNEA